MSTFPFSSKSLVAGITSAMALILGGFLFGGNVSHGSRPSEAAETVARKTCCGGVCACGSVCGCESCLGDCVNCRDCCATACDGCVADRGS
jgi:hypothetical protein